MVVLAKGLPQRLTPSEEAYAVGADDHNAYRDHCFALTAQDLDAGRFCRIGVTNARPTLMVWGDSHADAMMAAFDAAARAPTAWRGSTSPTAVARRCLASRCTSKRTICAHRWPPPPWR